MMEVLDDRDQNYESVTLGILNAKPEVRELFTANNRRVYAYP